MKKSIIRISVVSAVCSLMAILLTSCASENSNQVENEKPSAVWTEVSVPEAGSAGTSSGLIYLKPRETMETADYIFSGTIVGIKEYKVSYLDEETGKTSISLYHTVMEVKVDKEYKGTNPAEGDTIKIYYAFTLSITRDASVTIKDQTNYLFITKFLDEEHVKGRDQKSPRRNINPEEHADAYIGETIYSLAPIVDGNVFINTDFFAGLPDVLAKATDARCDLVPGSSPETSLSVAFKMEDFEPAIAEIIKNPSLIPKIHEDIDDE